MERAVTLSDADLGAVAGGIDPVSPDTWWVTPKGQNGQDLTPIRMSPFGPVDSSGAPIPNPD
jgi:hypothetical protein